MTGSRLAVNCMLSAIVDDRSSGERASFDCEILLTVLIYVTTVGYTETRTVAIQIRAEADFTIDQRRNEPDTSCSNLFIRVQ